VGSFCVCEGTPEELTKSVRQNPARAKRTQPDFGLDLSAAQASPKGKPGSERSETEAGAAHLATPRCVSIDVAEKRQEQSGYPSMRKHRRSRIAARTIWLPFLFNKKISAAHCYGDFCCLGDIFLI